MPAQPKRRNIATEQSPSSRTAAQSLERLDDQARAVRMRIGGLTFQQIADEFGVNRSTVHRWITNHLDAVVYENATLMRAQEGERLDRLQAAVWTTANKGNLRAIDRVLKIMERRARLFGLDQPMRVEADLLVSTSQAGDALDAKIAEVAARRSEAIDVSSSDVATEAS